MVNECLAQAQYLLDAHGKFRSPPYEKGQSSMNHHLPLQGEGVVSDLASRPLLGQCVPPTSLPTEYAPRE